MELVDTLQINHIHFFCGNMKQNILVNFGKIVGLFWVLWLHPDTWKICLIIQLYRKCTQAYPFKCSNSSSLCLHSVANSVFSLSLTSNRNRVASNSGNTWCDFQLLLQTLSDTQTHKMNAYLFTSTKVNETFSNFGELGFFFVKTTMFWLVFNHLIILFKIPKGNKYLREWIVFESYSTLTGKTLNSSFIYLTLC